MKRIKIYELDCTEDATVAVVLKLSKRQAEVLSRVLDTASLAIDCLGLDEWTSDESMVDKDEVLVDLASATNRFLPTMPSDAIMDTIDLSWSE